jgi:hypothetical protein
MRQGTGIPPAPYLDKLTGRSVPAGDGRETDGSRIHVQARARGRHIRPLCSNAQDPRHAPTPPFRFSRSALGHMYGKSARRDACSSGSSGSRSRRRSTTSSRNVVADGSSERVISSGRKRWDLWRQGGRACRARVLTTKTSGAGSRLPWSKKVWSRWRLSMGIGRD